MMSKYQKEDGNISWLSEKLVSWFTDLDPASLSPFEETMVSGIALILIVLIPLIFSCHKG